MAANVVGAKRVSAGSAEQQTAGLVTGDTEIVGAVPISSSEDGLDPSTLVQVFDRIALPTFVIDSNHVVRHWNSALEALTGLCRDEVIGTRNHWKPFYASPRPCLADLIIEGALDSEVQRYYTNKYRRSELIPDAYEAEDFFPECGEQGEWLHFTAASMLNSRGEVVGAIETLMNISDRKQAELELRERERTYREQSITDSLTGLYNSRYFYEQLDTSLETASRYQHPFSVCFLDLDRFKKLNDGYGHLFGDRVLETFGGLIRASLRATDSGYRYGGEEFALLLPSTSAAEARVVAERVRESLAAFQFQPEEGQSFSSTVSIGIAEYQVSDTERSLLERADQALYQAKARGRNCTVIATAGHSVR